MALNLPLAISVLWLVKVPFGRNKRKLKVKDMWGTLAKFVQACYTLCSLSVKQGNAAHDSRKMCVYHTKEHIFFRSISMQSTFIKNQSF